MSIKSYSRLDTVTCRALYRNSTGTVFKIQGMQENPFVIMHDVSLRPGSLVLASIVRISNDSSYVKVALDSVLDTAA